MRTDEIKNEGDEIKKWEDKIENIKQVNINMIFNNIKQKDFLAKVFILLKLVYTKLILIKPIYQKIW